MDKLRRTRQAIAALLLLLVLGLQVQLTFACEVADYHGAIENCCCHSEDPEPAMIPADPAGCCSYAQELSLKGADPAENREAIALGKSPDIEAPPLLIAALVVWLTEASSSAAPAIAATPDSLQSPGTRTWLATQRLRI